MLEERLHGMALLYLPHVATQLFSEGFGARRQVRVSVFVASLGRQKN